MLEDQKFQVESGNHENMKFTNVENEALSLTPLVPKIEVGINDLDEHIRGKIFNYLKQTEIPNVSLVCKQWKKEVDDFYEFEWTVGHNDDFGEKTVFKGPFLKKCTKCTIMCFPPLDDNFQFMKYPMYLKVLRIMAPLEPQEVQHIVSSSIKLEKLEFIEEFFNFPSILSLAQTPRLVQLKNLKEIICPELLHPHLDDNCSTRRSIVPISAFMDCYFPKLERIYLGLSCKRTVPPKLLWKFLKAHASTLQYINLRDINWDLSTNSELEDFRTSNVPNFVEMTVITNLWSPFWEKILSKQSNLQKLRFRIEIDTSDPDEIDLSGLPWIYFEVPITNSSNTLKSVDLNDLNMIIGNRCIPLNLSIFRSCLQLTKLHLSGVGSRPDSEEEMLSMVNGNDLPSSLLELSVCNIPMLSSDLLITLKKLKNLKTLELSYVGTTGNLGVTSSVLTAISGLEDLQNLEVAKFNTSDPEENEKLRIQFESLGKRFNGSDTYLYFRGNAHVELAILQEEEG